MNLQRSKGIQNSVAEGACQGKHGYPSFAAASRAAKGSMGRPRVKLGKLGAYRCPHCRDWHLGRSTP